MGGNDSARAVESGQPYTKALVSNGRSGYVNF